MERKYENCDHPKALDADSDQAPCRRYPPGLVTQYGHKSPNLGIRMGRACARGVEVRWPEVHRDERGEEFKPRQ